MQIIRVTFEEWLEILKFEEDGGRCSDVIYEIADRHDLEVDTPSESEA